MSSCRVYKPLLLLPESWKPCTPWGSWIRSSRADSAGLGGAGVPRPLLRCSGKSGSSAAPGVPSRKLQWSLTYISTHLCQTNILLLFAQILCRLTLNILLRHSCTAQLLYQFFGRAAASEFSVCEDNLVHMAKKNLFFSSIGQKTTTGNRSSLFFVPFSSLCCSMGWMYLFFNTILLRGLRMWHLSSLMFWISANTTSGVILVIQNTLDARCYRLVPFLSEKVPWKLFNGPKLNNFPRDHRNTIEIINVLYPWSWGPGCWSTPSLSQPSPTSLQILFLRQSCF